MATMDLAPVMATFLGLIMGIGWSNLDLYQIQNSHHGPFPGYGDVPGSYNGHMTVKSELVSDARQPTWTFPRLWQRSWVL